MLQGRTALQMKQFITADWLLQLHGLSSQQGLKLWARAGTAGCAPVRRGPVHILLASMRDQQGCACVLSCIL